MVSASAGGYDDTRAVEREAKDIVRGPARSALLTEKL